MNYIHYGHDSFDKKYLVETIDYKHMFRRYDKPHGLWASPVDSEIGWKDWCECEDFETESLEKSFVFTLKPCRVLHIKKPGDVTPYLDKVPSYPGQLCDHYKLNLSKIYQEYDAMELHLSENWRLRDMEVFYSWDVDSIVVWNPDVIIQQ